MANIIEKIIRENIFWNGVKHIFSPDSVSKYELCKYINEIYNLEIEINEFEDDQSRNMTLSSNYKNILKRKNLFIVYTFNKFGKNGFIAYTSFHIILF